MLLYSYSNLHVSNNVDILHSIRVAKLSSMLCNSFNINKKTKEIIMVSAMFHDIGKSKIDLLLLNKKGKLNNNDKREIKKHSIYGYILAKNAKYNENICKNILYHHENYDGTGYPKGIKGDKIPLGATIIRICDSYDAMRSVRPYKKSMGHGEAINELIENKNMYRKDLLDRFLRLDFSITEELYY